MSFIVVPPTLYMCMYICSGAVSPAISNVPMLQTVTVGNEVMVKCVVKGRGYDVIWSLRGVIIVSTNGTRLSECRNWTLLGWKKVS